MADHGVVCSMSPSGNVWDIAAMESSLKIDNPKRRHSTIGYLSPMESERQAGLA
jgi:putative transposase